MNEPRVEIRTEFGSDTGVGVAWLPQAAQARRDPPYVGAYIYFLAEHMNMNITRAAAHFLLARQ